MITLNTEEMIALNSILGSTPIYGISLVDTDIPEQIRVNQVMKTLETKEFIKNQSLTDKGLITTRLLEEYKQASIHVFINCLRIALIDDIHAIVIEKRKDNEYSISRILKETIVKKLILSAPYLQKETKKRFIPYIKEKVSTEELDRHLDTPKWTEMILIQKHEESRLTDNILYYMNTDIAYQYNYLRKERIETTPQDIRIELMKILEAGGITYA